MDHISGTRQLNDNGVGQDHEIAMNNQNQENNQNQVNSLQGQRSNGSAAVSGPSFKSITKPQPCRSYEVAEFYRKKKELQLKKIKDEEERLRRHKAKPMPNFKAIHSKANAIAKETVEPCVVSPDTPEVLRRGLAMKEKQKMKIKEYEDKLSERPAIVTRSAKVLKEEPFKPKLQPHQPLKMEPFNLHMDHRLKERKLWDDNYQRELAKKKEKEEQQKELAEARTRQAVRNQTIFKAKPNPFKKTQHQE